MNKKIIFALIALSLASIFCVVQSGTTPVPTVDVNASVNATLTVLAQQTEAALPQTGALTGTLSYPSEFIPPMRVVAFDAINTGVYFYVDTAQNEAIYTIENLPPGTYHVVAYRTDNPGLAGGYTQMVPCGLLASCEDHSLIDVAVVAGFTTEEIDPGDWYAPQDAFPAMPAP